MLINNIKLPITPRVFLVATILMLWNSCTDQGNPVMESTPEILLSTDTLSFGAVQISDSRLRTFEIINTGNAELTGEMSLDESGTPFTLQHTLGYTVTAGDTLSVSVLYQPGAMHSDTAVVVISSNAVNDPVMSILLVGSGSPLPVPAYDVSTQSVDFGTVVAGEMSIRTLVIRSVGTADLRIDSLEFTDSSVQLSGTTLPVIIAPNDSLVLTLSYSPDVAGTLSATLTIFVDVLGEEQISVSLIGEAQQATSFANDIQPIFNAKCVGCHGGSGGLILTTGNAYGNLVNVTSQGYAPTPRVTPDDLTNSVLYGKITNSGNYGGLMPQGGPALTTAQINSIQQWILQGAVNN